MKGHLAIAMVTVCHFHAYADRQYVYVWQSPRGADAMNNQEVEVEREDKVREKKDRKRTSGVTVSTSCLAQ